MPASADDEATVRWLEGEGKAIVDALVQSKATEKYGQVAREALQVCQFICSC